MFMVVLSFPAGACMLLNYIISWKNWNKCHLPLHVLTVISQVFSPEIVAHLHIAFSDQFLLRCYMISQIMQLFIVSFVCWLWKKMWNLLYPVSLCQTLVKSENSMAAIYKINFTKKIWDKYRQSAIYCLKVRT